MAPRYLPSGCGPGWVQPLDRVYHSADAQYPDGVVRHQLPTDGYRHHPVHYPGAPGYAATDTETAQPDAGHERPTTQAEGTPDALCQRPCPDLSRDDAGLPGGGRQSHRLPGPVGGPTANFDRPVSGVGPDSLHQAGRPGRAVREAVFLGSTISDLRGGSPGPTILGHESGRRTGRAIIHPYYGLRINLGPAEDDHDPACGCQAAKQPDHDALDDAGHDRHLFLYLSHRAVPILDNFQRHRHRHTIFYYRVGPAVPAVPQVGANPSAARRTSGKCGTRGDWRQWKHA